MRLIYVLPLVAILAGAGLMAQEVVVPAPPEPLGDVIAVPEVLSVESNGELVPIEDSEFAFLQEHEGPVAPHPPSSGNFIFRAEKGGSFLGVGVQEVNAERAKELKLADVHGVEITKVEDDSPASKAGLKQGDVVLEYQGQRVEGTEQFVRLVRETPAGRQVKLVVSRGGAAQTITAAVGERKPKHIMIERNFTMDPKWQQQMEKLQHEMGKMRIEIPDMPQPFMSWRSGVLGIEAESIGSQLAEFFGVKKGVLVRSVGKDTPAEKAGIKAGDVIVKVDNAEVGTPSDITKRVRDPEAKKTFPLTVVRNKQEMALNVTIADDVPGGAGGKPQRIVAPRVNKEIRVRTVANPVTPLL